MKYDLKFILFDIWTETTKTFSRLEGPDRFDIPNLLVRRSTILKHQRQPHESRPWARNMQFDSDLIMIGCFRPSLRLDTCRSIADRPKSNALQQSARKV